MRFLLFILFLLAACGGDKDTSGPQLNKFCGNFARTYDTMHLVSNNITYALEPKNVAADSAIWSMAHGQTGCVLANDPPVTMSGWYPNGAPATIIYVDSISSY